LKGKLELGLPVAFRS